MVVKNGELLAINRSTGKPLSNAAMTCPDMFSWKLFAEVIQDKFWSNWADENDNWPAQPYALCQADQKPGDNVANRVRLTTIPIIVRFIRVLSILPNLRV